MTNFLDASERRCVGQVLLARVGGALDEEPVQGRAAGQRIDGKVVVDRQGVQQGRAIEAAGGDALEMIDARPVIGVEPAPFGHDGVQGGQLLVRRQAAAALVVVGGAADEDVVAAAADEDVGARAADQQVAPSRRSADRCRVARRERCWPCCPRCSGRRCHRRRAGSRGR